MRLRARYWPFGEVDRPPEPYSEISLRRCSQPRPFVWPALVASPQEGHPAFVWTDRRLASHRVRHGRLSRGETSDTLLIRNYEFWNVFDPKRDYVATHTFDLGKSGKVSELVYLKGTATPTTVTLSRTPSNQGNSPLGTRGYRACEGRRWAGAAG